MYLNVFNSHNEMREWLKANEYLSIECCKLSLTDGVFKLYWK